jgi:prepilin-type N-terminal cleavage/methylation domain-containing protein
MIRDRRPAQRGFTMLELVISITVIGILSAIFLERSLTYQEYGEQTAMEVSLRNMRSGLRLKVADLMTRDQMNRVGELLDQNPVHWLPPPPPNYLGELRNPDPSRLAPGNWYFDAERKEVVYVPQRRRYLKIDNPAERTLRFRVEATKRGAIGALSGERTEGLALVPLVNYQWSW